MADAMLQGSCLCKAVRYEISPPFIRFTHCYCMRCRKATGGVKSSNISVPPEQFRWISGEDVISRWDIARGTRLCHRHLHQVQLPGAAADPGRPTVHRSRGQPR